MTYIKRLAIPDSQEMHYTLWKNDFTSRLHIKKTCASTGARVLDSETATPHTTQPVVTVACLFSRDQLNSLGSAI